MKNTYLPEAQNDRIFAFLGEFNKTSLITCGTVLVELVTLIIFLIRKKRKCGK